MRERERERERDRDRDRDRDRETDRQTDRQTDRHRDRDRELGRIPAFFVQPLAKHCEVKQIMHCDTRAYRERHALLYSVQS